MHTLSLLLTIFIFIFHFPSLRVMAILDHFGYPTLPLKDYNDPLWFNFTDFQPWLEHVKDTKRLAIIGDSVTSALSSNKKVQVTPDKISQREQQLDSKGSTLKKRDGRPEQRVKKTKRGRQVPSPESSPEPSSSSGKRVQFDEKVLYGKSKSSRKPTTGGKSPRVYFQVATSDISSGSETDRASTESN